MADRNVYGNDFSENGWRMVDTGSCVWVTIPGTDPAVRLQIREGQPAAVMGAFAADFNAYVEQLRDADSACWTATNSVSTSNHLSGTAMDLNWDSHPFRIADAGFDADEKATVTELLDFYEGTIFWGNNWDSPKDAMHFQMGYDTYGSENVDKVNDFIRRKVRADGSSTFRRQGAVTPPPAPAVNAVEVLVRATGVTVEKAREVQPLVAFALAEGNCTNPRRIAAALAQWVIESGHFVYTEEIADGPEAEERWKYKGRTWIQLTWLENYRGFSVWCHGLGLVPTPDYFVVHPHELADEKWAALGPAYWWAVKYPQINEYADRGDIDNVSKWVNALAWVDKPDKHANGEKERRDVYNQALALGDQLLTLISDTGDDFMSALNDDEQREVLALLRWIAAPDTGELRKKFKSRSPLRHTDEGFVETVAGFVLNIDAHEHVEIVKTLAGYGDPDALALLREVASNTEPGREHDAQFAQAILAEASSTPVLPTPAASGLDVQRAIINQAVAAPVLPVASTTGQLIGNAYDAAKALLASPDMDDTEKSAAAALISVLQTKTGVSA